MYEDSHLATPGEAHAEWHRNAGVPMGQPGCPQDACHPVDDYDYLPEETAEGVRCGNRKAHPQGAYHASVEDVRSCYEAWAPMRDD